MNDFTLWELEAFTQPRRPRDVRVVTAAARKIISGTAAADMAQWTRELVLAGAPLWRASSRG